MGQQKRKKKVYNRKSATIIYFANALCKSLTTEKKNEKKKLNLKFLFSTPKKYLLSWKVELH